MDAVVDRRPAGVDADLARVARRQLRDARRCACRGGGSSRTGRPILRAHRAARCGLEPPRGAPDDRSFESVTGRYGPGLVASHRPGAPAARGRGGLPHAARALPGRGARASTRPTTCASATSATPSRSAARSTARACARASAPHPRRRHRHRRRHLAARCARASCRGVEAFSQRPLYARGDLDLAVGFEGLFRLPNGRPPLLRIHDVRLPGRRVSTLTMGEGPDVLLHPRPRRHQVLVLRHRRGADAHRATASTRSTCRASARRPSRSPRPYSARWFADTVVDVMDALDIEPRAPRRQLDGRARRDRGRPALARARDGLALLCPAVAFVSRDWHPLVRLLRPELGLLPHHFGAPRGRRASSGPCSPTRDPLDPAVADVVVDEFQRIYAGRARGWRSSPRRATSTSSGPSAAAASTRAWPTSSAPALFVWGTHDKLIPAGFRATSAQLAARRAEQVVLDDCGHVPQVERPERDDRAAAGVPRARRRAACARRAAARRGLGRRGGARGHRRAGGRSPRGRRDRPRPRHAAGRPAHRRAAHRPRDPRAGPRAAARVGRPRAPRLAACRPAGCGRSTPLVVTDGPVLGGCPVLPPGAAYNRDVSARAARSRLGRARRGPGRGPPDPPRPRLARRSEYGIPFAVVPADAEAPAAGVRHRRRRLLQRVRPRPGARCPRPRRSRAMADAAGDRHVLVLQRGPLRAHRALQRRARRGDAAWRVSSAARWDLTREQRRRPAGFTSADAAGLPILPGLLRYDEAAWGSIRHALRFTLPRARRAYQPPASHCGTTTDARAPPYGSRWRLKASFDESPYRGPALAIVRALKRYGLMFADQGSAMYVSGTSDPRWAPVDRRAAEPPPDRRRGLRGGRGRRREHLRIAIASADGRDHRAFAQRAQLQPGRRRPAPKPTRSSGSPRASPRARSRPPVRRIAGQVVSRVPPPTSTSATPTTSARRCRACGCCRSLWFRGEVRGLGNIPEEGAGPAGGQPLRRQPHARHRRLHARLHRLLRRRAALPPARPQPRAVDAGARLPAQVRHGRRLARERRAGAAQRAPPCSSTPAATTRSTGRPGRAARVDFDGRKGFVRLALDHDVPIVPVVAIGGQETALFLSRGERLAQAALCWTGCCA